MSDKQQDKRLQQQCWRQQSALPIAGADFAGDDEDEDDDMLLEVTIRPLPSSTSMAKTLPVRRLKVTWTPSWAANRKSSAWHRF